MVPIIVLALLLQNFGVLINNPFKGEIEIVKTDAEPKRNHHPILDDPKYSHLLPYTVTVKVKDKAIRTITVIFDVVDTNGVSHSIQKIFTMKAGNALERNSTWQFWPGGRISYDPEFRNRHPLMAVHPIDLEHAKSVTFTIDYIQFEDGTVIGPNTLETERKLRK